MRPRQAKAYRTFLRWFIESLWIYRYVELNLRKLPQDTEGGIDRRYANRKRQLEAIYFTIISKINLLWISWDSGSPLSAEMFFCVCSTVGSMGAAVNCAVCGF
ncbi:MAG TPA: hypothetical protein VGQ39_07340 [Pyrinomonadaceae bacterium]|nr:hypothetical protein [Pyrinomonadaceae bacterium]